MKNGTATLIGTQENEHKYGVWRFHRYRLDPAFKGHEDVTLVRTEAEWWLYQDDEVYLVPTDHGGMGVASEPLASNAEDRFISNSPSDEEFFGLFGYRVKREEAPSGSR